MTSRLWIETTYHPAFRYGGWAYVREVDGIVSGMAGGERNLAAGHLDLAGLLAALSGLPAGPVAVKSSNRWLLAALRLARDPPAPDSDEAPSEDLDLWAHLIVATKPHPITVQEVVHAPKTPTAFLLAWADVAQDKAKMTGSGRFSAVIPRPNLAKLALG